MKGYVFFLINIHNLGVFSAQGSFGMDNSSIIPQKSRFVIMDLMMKKKDVAQNLFLMTKPA